MELTLTSTLSLFVLIALSTAIFFASKRFRVSYTVLLVLVGLLLVPIVSLPYLKVVFGFIGDMVLTPELLFYIFLPVLIFESGFNMNIRKMLDNAWIIGLLSVVSVIISSVVTAALLYYLLPLIGIHIPFIIGLMFGALISSTDPAAVLSLFKELGVPPRLTMIFEGECLLNDGTAIALFFVFFAVAMSGFDGSQTVIHGIFEFIVMILGGGSIGLIMAALFSRALRFTRKNEFVTVTLLIISAHLVFILTEMINHLGYFHVSSIVATAVASLFLGNYSRHILAPKTDEYLGKLIEHMAFIVNSLVFLMAGLLFANSGVDVKELWLPILITVFVVALARFLSVYMVTIPLNAVRVEEQIPSSWEKLLAWGSLRGALSIIIVLMIPKDFIPEGWDYQYSPHDLLLALTIGCILATLFIKAPLINPIMKRYRINQPEPLKEAYESDMGIYYLLTARSRLQDHRDKGFFNQAQYEKLLNQVEEHLHQADLERQELLASHGSTVFAQSLHLAMVHIEVSTLKYLYLNDEVNERNYRKVLGKLFLQQEKIEYAQHNKIDPNEYIDKKAIFDVLVNYIHSFSARKPSKQELLEEELQYYRSQMIMARKAVLVMQRIQNEFDQPVFMPSIYAQVSARYERYRDQSYEKMEALIEQHSQELSAYRAKLAERSLTSSGAKALLYLHEVGLVDESIEDDLQRIFNVSD